MQTLFASDPSSSLLVPVVVSAIGALLLWSPTLARRTGPAPRYTALLTLLLVATVLTSDPRAAFVLVAVSALLHWHEARDVTRTGSAAFAISAVAASVVAAALWVNASVVAYVASLVAIGVRVGVIPLHTGAAQLCERRPALQSQQLATTIGLAVAHLRFADSVPLAYDLAPFLVRYGALMTLLPAMMALVQRDLRAFYRSATVMHGGMLLAALGAAGRGHHAAALMVMLTIAVAMGGLGIMVEALEARVGPVSLVGRGGRIQAFPKLAAAFALFGGAGVAMPGTAGFIADDLMLHALWEESVIGTLTMILGSALLAVATLMTYSRVFLGPAVPSLAADLGRRERLIVVTLVLLLVWLGVTPGLLLTPADQFLRSAADLVPAH